MIATFTPIQGLMLFVFLISAGLTGWWFWTKVKAEKAKKAALPLPPPRGPRT